MTEMTTDKRTSHLAELLVVVNTLLGHTVYCFAENIDGFSLLDEYLDLSGELRDMEALRMAVLAVLGTNIILVAGYNSVTRLLNNHHIPRIIMKCLIVLLNNLPFMVIRIYMLWVVGGTKILEQGVTTFFYFVCKEAVFLIVGIVECVVSVFEYCTREEEATFTLDIRAGNHDPSVMETSMRTDPSLARSFSDPEQSEVGSCKKINDRMSTSENERDDESRIISALQRRSQLHRQYSVQSDSFRVDPNSELYVHALEKLQAENDELKQVKKMKKSRKKQQNKHERYSMEERENNWINNQSEAFAKSNNIIQISLQNIPEEGRDTKEADVIDAHESDEETGRKMRKSTNNKKTQKDNPELNTYYVDSEITIPKPKKARNRTKANTGLLDGGI